MLMGNSKHQDTVIAYDVGDAVWKARNGCLAEGIFGLGSLDRVGALRPAADVLNRAIGRCEKQGPQTLMLIVVPRAAASSSAAASGWRETARLTRYREAR